MHMTTKTMKMLGVAAMAAACFASTAPAVEMDESTLGSFPQPGTDLFVDWMVTDAAAFGYAGAYAYMYQVEVPENVGTRPEIFTVSFDTANVLDYGFLAGDDLDLVTLYHVAHASAGDHEGFALEQRPIIATLNSDNISWFFQGGLSPGSQSETVYFIDPNPPRPGIGGAQNGAPPSPWSSQAPTGEPVPVPGGDNQRVPDAGSSVLLLGAALSSLGIMMKKKLA
jgi:hypothetical protein